MTDYVNVMLRHPNGLLLKLVERIEVQEPVPGGGTRPVKTTMPYVAKGPDDPYGPVTLHGYNRKNRVGKDPLPAITSKFTVTKVPKVFWDAWVEQNHDHAFLEAGILFATDASNASAASEVKNRDSIKCGYEPFVPGGETFKRVSTFNQNAFV